MNCFDDLQARGIIDNTSNDEVIKQLNEGTVSF